MCWPCLFNHIPKKWLSPGGVSQGRIPAVPWGSSCLVKRVSLHLKPASFPCPGLRSNARVWLSVVHVDYVKGFGGKFGVQTDRQDKCALGWDHQEKLQLHESQKGTSSSPVPLLFSGPLGSLRLFPSRSCASCQLCFCLSFIFTV